MSAVAEPGGWPGLRPEPGGATLAGRGRCNAPREGSHSRGRAFGLGAMSWVASEPRVGYALEKRRMTADEFLAWDEGQTVRHEFVLGEVFAMAGG